MYLKKCTYILIYTFSGVKKILFIDIENTFKTTEEKKHFYHPDRFCLHRYFQPRINIHTLSFVLDSWMHIVHHVHNNNNNNMINNRKSKRHRRRHLIRFYRPVQTSNLKRWPLRRLRVRYNINNMTIAIGGTNARRKTNASSARAGLWNFFLSRTRIGFYSTKRLSLFCSLGFGLTLIVFICMIVQRSNISSTNFNYAFV